MLSMLVVLMVHAHIGCPARWIPPSPPSMRITSLCRRHTSMPAPKRFGPSFGALMML